MIHEKNEPSLTVERKLDPMTGDVRVRYLWDGNPVPQVPISGVIAEQLSGLAMIQKDLGNALKWFEKAAVLADTIRVDAGARYVKAEVRETADDMKALFVAALVFYAKAFTEAAGRRAHMSRDWLAKEFREAHDYYMSLRHNMAAHSGAERVEFAESYILLLPVGPGKTHPRIATSRRQPDFVSSEDVNERFATLISHASKQVAERYDKLAQRITESVIEKGPKFWAAAAEREEAVDFDKLMKRSKGKTK